MVLERNFLGADAGIFRQNEVPMKKIPLKRIFAAAALVCCLTVTTAYADVTQEDIDNAKNQINNLKNQQKDAQDAVDDINGKKGQLESDLNNLNGQMTNIVSSMNALESQINDKKKELSDLEDEIDQTQDNLEAAKQQSASQYEDMKIRIRSVGWCHNISNHAHERGFPCAIRPQKSPNAGSQCQIDIIYCCFVFELLA